MTDEELLQCNREGLIPGPEETEKNFLERIENARKGFDSIPRSHWEWARLRVKELYDFEPVWLQVYYSNRGLSFWEGAACWIENGKIGSIQLREGLKKGRYLGLYDRDEILAHEAVHGARCAFEESGSEEFFAYSTSDKKWRRVLGPIMRRPWEIWPFLGLVSMWVLFQWLGIFWEGLELGAGICFLGMAFWIGLGFCRLIRHHLVLKKACKAALHCVSDPLKVRALLFRLTDREIGWLAKGGDLRDYAKKQNCLRWKLIRLAYL